MSALNGKWWYQSFCPLAATDKFTPQIAGPWTPQTEMELKTNADNSVEGTATLKTRAGALSLKVIGSVTPVIKVGDITLIPEGVELTVTVIGMPVVYNLRGFFLENSTHLVGTVVAMSNDLGRQPVGTSGPFVLFPV